MLKSLGTADLDDDNERFNWLNTFFCSQAKKSYDPTSILYC